MNPIDPIVAKDPARFASDYFAHLTRILQSIDVQEIARFVATLLDARERQATIFFIGNGGSASTASHFANDLAFGIRSENKPFRAISLTDNLSMITALANDCGYHEIFVRQLRMLGRAGDVLVGISASGNSPNILEAMAYARVAGIKTVALTAFDGGKLRAMADEGVHVPTAPKEYGPAEDAHLILDHLITGYLARVVSGA